MRNRVAVRGCPCPLTRVMVVLAGMLLTACPVVAASPTLSLILPRGVQRGGDRELEFRGARMRLTGQIPRPTCTSEPTMERT